MTNSPTQTVGCYPAVSALVKTVHPIPLLSLDKTKSSAELLRFAGEQMVMLMLKLDGLTLDEGQHTVTIDGQRITLTYKEYELLRLFLSHPGMAFSREQLLQTVWNTDYAVETRTVDMHIRTLRQKLGAYGQHIETIRGVGYRLEGNHDKQNL